MPGTRSLFETVDLDTQKSSLLAVLITLRESLRDLSVIAPDLEELGARHVDYGALPEHYPVVGTVLLETMAEMGGSVWRLRIYVGVGRGLPDRAGRDAQGCGAEIVGRRLGQELGKLKSSAHQSSFTLIATRGPPVPRRPLRRRDRDGAELHRGAPLRHGRAGDPLWRHRSRPVRHHCGQLRCPRPTPGGPWRACIFQRGDIFGDLAFFDGEP